MRQQLQLAPPFLTVAEVAQLTRLSKATVYRLVRTGRLRAVRFGRSYRISESEVAVYIARATLNDSPTATLQFPQ
jgi:excisionase family DNA binding protein